MMKQCIYLDSCGWTLTVYYVVSVPDIDAILDKLESTGCKEKELCKAERNLLSGDLNVGLTYSNLETRSTVMVIGAADSPEQFADTLIHERGHLVMHISRADGLDPFGEEVQYINGEAARKMFSVSSKFLCEHCRCNIMKERKNTLRQRVSMR